MNSGTIVIGLILALTLFKGKTPMAWKTPEKGLKYEATFKEASLAYEIPHGVLSRMAYQESRYNPNAVSPVGAQGLMQFMPATAKELNVDPLNPAQAIWGAARYLKWLFDTTGSWPLALAAYNWGIGNVVNKGMAKAPRETLDYVASITRDTGLTV